MASSVNSSSSGSSGSSARSIPPAIARGANEQVPAVPVQPTYVVPDRRFNKVPYPANQRIAIPLLKNVCDFLQTRDLSRFPVICQN